MTREGLKRDFGIAEMDVDSRYDMPELKSTFVTTLTLASAQPAPADTTRRVGGYRRRALT